MQRKADIRRIPKHVEMLFGKTCLCLFVCEDVTFPPCVFEFTFISAHFTSVTLRLGSRAGRVSWLPSALYQLPCIQIRSPSYLFLQLTHLSEAKCGVQKQYKTVSPRCGKSFLCHTRAFADIAVQIVGNYDFSSRGKYARISSYNWSMLKIKAVGGFSVMLLVLFVFCFCFFLFPRRVKC